MERRVERLQTGRVNIVHLLSTLPASHHQLEHFTVDSYMLPPVGTLQIMAVNVHGHFWEGTHSLVAERSRLMQSCDTRTTLSHYTQQWKRESIVRSTEASSSLRLHPARAPCNTACPWW